MSYGDCYPSDGYEVIVSAVKDPLAGAVTRLLVVARDGNDEAVAHICDLLYGELRGMAHARLRTQQPLTLLDTTALVHESFLRLANADQVAMTDRDLHAAALLLEEVLDLPEPEWQDWFARRTDISEPLLLVLKEMLAAEARGACKLPPLPQYSPGELSALTQATDDLPAGTVIGPYRLLREIGRGGMGSVWLAERSDGTLKRQVALKLPHTSLPHRLLAERFARERDILAELVHPNVARLYDAGVTDQGQPYLALEYVEGQPLLAYCRKSELDLASRLSLFLQVLGAIQYAHSHLVVHRDLKPSNILVTRDGEVRLLDFGIAKLLTDGEANETELTQLGGRALTPQYAAPEQLLGQSIGTAADVYGLGIVLYELLTGALPYRLKRDTRGALEEAILASDPAPPSQVAKESTDVAGWAKRLKGDIDTIVLKALKKNPAERYVTVAAFADDIVRFLKGEPVEAQPDSAWYRSRKFLVRHRLGAVVTVMVLAALSTSLGVALWQAEAARKEARTATAVKEFMQSIFLANTAQQADPQKAREMTARELLDIGAEQIDAGLADAPEARAEMLEMFTVLYEQLGLSGKAADFGQKWTSATRELYGPNSIELVWALAATATVFRSQSKDHPAQGSLLDEAQAILDRRGGSDADDRAELLVASWVYWQDHQFPRVLAEARSAVKLMRKPETVGLVSTMAARLSALGGDHVSARDLAAKGIASALEFNAHAEAGRGLHTLLPLMHQVSGEAAWALGDLVDAEQQFRQALRLSKQTLGTASDVTTAKGGRLAEFLLLTGRMKEGNDLLEKLTEGPATLPASDTASSSYEALEAIGRAQYAAGQYSASLDSLSKVLALRPTIDASPHVADVLRRQVRAFLALHRQEEAARALERAVAMRIKSGLQNPAVEREEAELRARLFAGT